MPRPILLCAPPPRRLTESPLLTSVVWESLRLAPSVYGGFRRATADAVVGGHEIKSGTLARSTAPPLRPRPLSTQAMSSLQKFTAPCDWLPWDDAVDPA